MPSLSEALTRFLRVERSPLTNYNYELTLAPLVRAIGPQRDVARVVYEELDDYVAHLRAVRDLQTASVRNYVRIIKTFFGWCVRQNWLNESPAHLLYVYGPGQPPVNRAVPIAILSVMRELARLDPRDHAVLLFLVDSGCRAGGAASLTTDRLDLVERSALLVEKGSRWHTVYFGGETAEALGVWLQVRANVAHKHVFTSRGPVGHPLKPRAISDVVRRLSLRAGADRPWGAHALRHAVGHAYAAAGVPVTVTQAKLGHSSPSVTMRFYYPNGADAVRAVSERLPLAPLGSPREADKKIIPFRADVS